MIRFAGRIFVLHGRFVQVPRLAVAAQIARRGGTVQRGLTRRCAHLAVGWGAAGQIATGQLHAKLDRAEHLHVATVSEGELLQALGLLPAETAQAAGMSRHELIAKSGLAADDLRYVELFDLIPPAATSYNLRDLVVTRDIARLLQEGLSLGEIITARLLLHRDDPEGHRKASIDLVRMAPGAVALRSGNTLADLDGQLRLPLIDSDDQHGVDELFEAAEAAEAAGDFERAEALYRRCAAADSADPTAPFNLANVLRENGRLAEAELYFKRAATLDPAFAEAWYNLACLMEQRAQNEPAKQFLQHALAADSAYGDALYNLARLHFVDGAYDRAGRFWQRYLELDAHSEWAQKARRGVTACRNLGPTAMRDHGERH